MVQAAKIITQNWSPAITVATLLQQLKELQAQNQGQLWKTELQVTFTNTAWCGENIHHAKRMDHATKLSCWTVWLCLASSKYGYAAASCTDFAKPTSSAQVDSAHGLIMTSQRVLEAQNAGFTTTFDYVFELKCVNPIHAWTILSCSRHDHFCKLPTCNSPRTPHPTISVFSAPFVHVIEQRALTAPLCEGTSPGNYALCPY